MLLSTFAFSLMQLCVKYLSHIPTPELILFRSVISLVLSLTFLLQNGISPLGNDRKGLFMRGFFGMMALTLFFVTLQNMPMATAVTLQYLSPIFTSVIAVFFLKERIRNFQWAFYVLALVGVLLIRGFDQRVTLTYLLAGIGSAIFAGVAYNFIRRARDTDHPVVVVLYFPLVAIPVMAVASWFMWVTPSPKDWPIILLLGIFTQIGQVFMTKALQAEKANIVTSLKYLGAVYALLYGYFLFGESYGFVALFGFGLVLAGVMGNVVKGSG
jgi:drug/metabolite transporter (DMT)-like permease